MPPVQPSLPIVITAWLSVGAAAPPPTAVHVVIDAERAYMGAVQKRQIEHWLAPDMSWTNDRGRVTITRRDLGVRWRLDAAAKSYAEEKLSTPSGPAAPPAGDDIHTARFDYEPEFDWTITPGARMTVAGRPAREYTALGHADYARSALRFALGSRVTVETTPDVNRLLADLVQVESVSLFLRNTTRARGNGVILSFEETDEPAIAPTIVQRATVSTLEVIAPPVGIFDLPAGFSKASR